MIDALDAVRDHYSATGLTERLETALAFNCNSNQYKLGSRR